jgi:hypothetical protein
MGYISPLLQTPPPPFPPQARENEIPLIQQEEYECERETSSIDRGKNRLLRNINH